MTFLPTANDFKNCDYSELVAICQLGLCKCIKFWPKNTQLPLVLEYCIDMLQHTGETLVSSKENIPVEVLADSIVNYRDEACVNKNILQCAFFFIDLIKRKRSGCNPRYSEQGCVSKCLQFSLLAIQMYNENLLSDFEDFLGVFKNPSNANVINEVKRQIDIENSTRAQDPLISLNRANEKTVVKFTIPKGMKIKKAKEVLIDEIVKLKV